MSIELPPDVQRHLAREAERRGIPQNEYAVQLIQKGLTPEAPVPAVNESLVVDPTRALLQKWREEDEAALAQMTPEEIAAAEAQTEELLANLQANRLTLPVPDLSEHG